MIHFSRTFSIRFDADTTSGFIARTVACLVLCATATVGLAVFVGAFAASRTAATLWLRIAFAFLAFAVFRLTILVGTFSHFINVWFWFYFASFEISLFVFLLLLKMTFRSLSSRIYIRVRQFYLAYVIEYINYLELVLRDVCKK